MTDGDPPLAPFADEGMVFTRRQARGDLGAAVLAYGIFFAFSVLGRWIPEVFYLVMLAGIAFPLVWAALTRDWAGIGLTRRHWKEAVLWGMGLGVGLGGLAYLALTSQGRHLPQDAPLLPLIIGIVLSFLVVSPFQEFFFRGWLQPRFQAGLGKWLGLLTCSLAFALWDVLPPLNAPLSTTAIITSIASIPVSFSVALLFGYSLQRTGNMLAPWLAHAIVVVALLMTGQLVLYRAA